MGRAVLDFTSFYTLSAIFLAGALAAIMNARPTVAAVLLMVTGSGGLGIFWERWSRRAGDDVHVTAILHPVAPTAAQWGLLISHGLILAVGIAMIAGVAWKRDRRREATS